MHNLHQTEPSASLDRPNLPVFMMGKFAVVQSRKRSQMWILNLNFSSFPFLSLTHFISSAWNGSSWGSSAHLILTQIQLHVLNKLTELQMNQKKKKKKQPKINFQCISSLFNYWYNHMSSKAGIREWVGMCDGEKKKLHAYQLPSNSFLRI